MKKLILLGCIVLALICSAYGRPSTHAQGKHKPTSTGVVRMDSGDIMDEYGWEASKFWDLCYLGCVSDSTVCHLTHLPWWWGSCWKHLQRCKKACWQCMLEVRDYAWDHPTKSRLPNLKSLNIGWKCMRKAK